MHLSDRIVMELLERGEIETDPVTGDVRIISSTLTRVA